MTLNKWKWVGPQNRPPNDQKCGWCGRKIGFHFPDSMEVCLTKLSNEEIKGYNDLRERCVKAETELAKYKKPITRIPGDGDPSWLDLLEHPPEPWWKRFWPWSK